MTNAAIEDTPAEATGTQAEEANLDTEAKGTPAADATVQAGTNGATPDAESTDTPTDPAADTDAAAVDEPKHSDARLSAERESVRDETLREARTAHAASIRERDDAYLKLLDVAAEDKGIPNAKPLLIRAVRQEALKLEPKFDANGDPLPYTDDELQPLVSVVSRVWDVMTPTALAYANQVYTAAINRLFPDPKDQTALWEEAASAGLTNVDKVLELAIEKKALQAESIRTATAEAVEKVNNNVKKARLEHGDARYKDGRAQGNKDRVGDRSGGGGGGTGERLDSKALNEKYTDSQFAALPKEERSRLTKEAHEVDAQGRR